MNYAQIMARQKSCENRWLKVNRNLTHQTGIYILEREDEIGLKYAYIGQAKDVLKRLGQHLLGYQHIDLSLKKHKLYSEENPYGWCVTEIVMSEKMLDEAERYYIKEYALNGYQLRNKTAGGQDKGKVGIDDNKSSKGYHDGLKQGYNNAMRDIKVFFDKYLDYKIKGDTNKIKERKLEEFTNMLYNK